MAPCAVVWFQVPVRRKKKRACQNFPISAAKKIFVFLFYDFKVMKESRFSLLFPHQLATVVKSLWWNVSVSVSVFCANEILHVTSPFQI